MLWDGISSKIYFDDYRLIERYSQNVIAIYVEASNAQKCLNWFSAELKEITFDGATDVIVLYSDGVSRNLKVRVVSRTGAFGDDWDTIILNINNGDAESFAHKIIDEKRLLLYNKLLNV